VKAVRALAGVMLVAGLATIAAQPASAAAPRGVYFERATVTAARSGKNSAVVMLIKNHSGGPISLLSVTSQVSGMSMIYFDDNMCQGSTKMTWLSDILIFPGKVQKLGYRYQGAMLGSLHQKLVEGSTVPLDVRWSDFNVVTTTVVEAKVVAPPKGLHFYMSPMHMKM
jgi:copper(I)-binding protein